MMPFSIGSNASGALEFDRSTFLAPLPTPHTSKSFVSSKSVASSAIACLYSKSSSNTSARDGQP
eukprot:3701384-Pyramimonas_sp.AAC.1